MEYPKIETLYNRDERFKVNTDRLRWAEFGNVKTWLVTEKVDGTNIRVMWNPVRGLRFAGRTDAAQIPPHLLAYLQAVFTPDKMDGQFVVGADTDVILYGEGYGPKIQKGGGDYRSTPGFRLFDVLVGSLWLEWENVEGVAAALGIASVPWLATINALPQSATELAAVFATAGQSLVALQDGGAGCQAEGIVARSYPLMLTRRGERIMWKLKFRDFVAGKR